MPQGGIGAAEAQLRICEASLAGEKQKTRKTERRPPSERREAAGDVRHERGHNLLQLVTEQKAPNPELADGLRQLRGKFPHGEVWGAGEDRPLSRVRLDADAKAEIERHRCRGRDLRAGAGGEDVGHRSLLAGRRVACEVPPRRSKGESRQGLREPITTARALTPPEAEATFPARATRRPLRRSEPTTLQSSAFAWVPDNEPSIGQTARTGEARAQPAGPPSLEIFHASPDWTGLPPRLTPPTASNCRTPLHPASPLD